MSEQVKAPPSNLKQLGMLATVTVRSILDNKYRNENRLKQLFVHTNANAVGDPVIQVLQQAFDATYGDSERARLEELRPFLTRIRETVPIAKIPGKYETIDSSAEAKAIDDLVNELIVEGEMEEYFVAQPAVEHWVGETGRRAADMLLQRPETVRDDGRKTVEILIGITLATRELLNGVNVWLREFPKAHDEWQTVGTVVTDIRHATYFTMLRHLVEETVGDPIPGFLDVFDRYLEHVFREYGIEGTESEEFKPWIEKMHRDRDTVKEAFRVLERNSNVFPELAEGLLRCLPLDAPIDPKYQRVLPPGVVTVVYPAAVENDARLYYTAHGTYQNSFIGLSSAENPSREDEGWSDRNEAYHEPYALEQVVGCKIDSAGKPFTDRSVDRFAPALMNAQWAHISGILQRADAFLNQELIDLWARFPQIFGDLMTVGPVILVPEGGAVHMLCRAAVVDDVAKRLDTEKNDAETTAYIAQFAKVSLRDEWSSVSVGQKETDDEDDLPGEKPDAERRKVRQSIRKFIGKRVPSLDWIIERLAELGDVRTAQRPGRGTSHQSIVFTRKGETRHYTTDPSIRSTESLSYKILYAILRTLHISEQEFYEQCCGGSAL